MPVGATEDCEIHGSLLGGVAEGVIDFALGGLAIGRLEVRLEPSRLGAGRDQGDVVVLGLLQSLLVLAAGELGCRGLAQTGAQFYERDE